MRADFIRIYKSIHTWTGIVSGMALFIAFYAGALTVFKDPITRWVSPPSQTRIVPLEALQPLIQRTLAERPESAREFSITLESATQARARLDWQLRAPDADDHDETATRHFGATLDATNTLLVHEANPSPLAYFIDVLHRVVGLPTDTDPHRWLMGVVAVLYSLALVSGVVVLLPSLVKDFFALRVGKNLKRMWLDAHNVVGIISLPFHIVMALTAVVFAFHDQIYEVQDKTVHQGRWAQAFQRPQPKPGVVPARDPAALLTPQQIVQAVRAVAPTLEPSMLQYQQVLGPRAVVRVWGKDAASVLPRARGGFAAIDPYSGKLLATDYLPGHQNTPNLVVSSFFALHMAAFGGLLVPWLYFLLGLAGAWLFYSGNLLWIETRRRRAARDASGPTPQRRDTRLMASATVGICLGCVCGVSLTILGGKWLQGTVAELSAGHQMLYYSAFFACIAWAFWRGAARAAVHLLWAAAVLTLALPLSTLASWLVAAANGMAPGIPAAPGVDLTALVGALCLMTMARATARRADSSATDSVWSAAATPGAARSSPPGDAV